MVSEIRNEFPNRHWGFSHLCQLRGLGPVAPQYCFRNNRFIISYFASLINVNNMLFDPHLWSNRPQRSQIFYYIFHNYKWGSSSTICFVISPGILQGFILKNGISWVNPGVDEALIFLWNKY